MVHIARWKRILILLVCTLGLAYAAPNALTRTTVESWAEALPGWLPVRQVNLGLDLQGGSHLLAEIQYGPVVEQRLESVVDALRSALREADIGYVNLQVADGAAGFRVRDPADLDQALDIARGLEDPGTYDVTSDESGNVSVALTEEASQELVNQLAQQSIEIIRRRVDETGTTEPVIQRQGFDRILIQLPGVDDPERVKDIIGQTAQMSFHLLDTNVTPADVQAGRVPPGTLVVPAGPGDARGPGFQYALRRRAELTGDNLVNAAATFDQNSQPVVSFQFDSVGGRRFAEITRENVGQQFAIVLDDEVISAPVIEEPILGGQGIIRGQFSVQTAQDLALLLRAGALPADLTYLEERTVGPGLGQDSIDAGKLASIIGFLLVIGFMLLCYGLFGVFANIALVFNLALILAALSALQATLTLPGIAGIVLTVGMAVDANVLIFERIREEVRNGRSPISAIDAGYSRALTTIIDSNLTTLIAAVLLYALGSGPVRGFAVTLAIGIVSSMFTAIMLTRLIVVTWLRRRRPAALPL